MHSQQKQNGITLGKNDVVSSTKKLKEENSSLFAKEGRILLVDDEMDIVKLYKHGLRRDGFEVEAFNDPEMALSHFKPDAYDLAILDIRMPKMNGFELYREMRKRDEKIRICFMTAFEMHLKEFEKVLPSIKVDGLLTKPIHIVDLCSTVQRLLNNSNSRDKT
jgi:two-component system, OmpR family, response regulator ChvI